MLCLARFASANEKVSSQHGRGISRAPLQHGNTNLSPPKLDGWLWQPSRKLPFCSMGAEWITMPSTHTDGLTLRYLSLSCIQEEKHSQWILQPRSYIFTCHWVCTLLAGKVSGQGQDPDPLSVCYSQAHRPGLVDSSFEDPHIHLFLIITPLCNMTESGSQGSLSWREEF